MNDIEKKIKALEIINEKDVNVKIIRVASCLENYNTLKTLTSGKNPNTDLNQEEYDLLKEVLLVLIYKK